jgi:hypothetical protein
MHRRSRASLVSPLLLIEISHVKGEDWQQLSNVGQTYGVASAILAGIALLGVAVSLVVQARQARTERIRIVRERHLELLRMVLENPAEYGPIIGVNPNAVAEKVRPRLFAVLWMNYARMGYQMNVLSETSLRGEVLPGLFDSDLGRTWWEDVRKLWLNSPVPEKKAREFAELADSEYRRAIASGSASIIFEKNHAKEPEATGLHSSFPVTPFAIAAAAALGYAIGAIISRSKDRS